MWLWNITTFTIQTFWKNLEIKIVNMMLKYGKRIYMYRKLLKNGYIFAVNLEYLKYLHDYHEDLLFSPEGRIKLVGTLENK